jgi:hypothetical protein
MSSQSIAQSPHPERIGNRYRVQELLGRGGMAIVYRVTDIASGRQTALKQLVPPADDKLRREAAALFEREFHTLAQLSHPCVVEVYDYGVDVAGAYYTMELLDGGDLRERSPMPWREACSLLFDVCSSLALLHSRRLVHRDVSPRNVRCTQQGSAKLIDFGAMVPMGQGGQIVGTPPFVAPEVVHRSTLDARTDLFSLGATLYFALTGRAAYPARDFAQLLEAWSVKPPAPSSLVADIPAALDGLVMSLIALEPVLRPASAFEVMQRLGAIAGIERIEALGVSQAYLSTPVMVGREEPLAVIQAAIAAALHRRGAALLICGAAGLGRSRMLDASVLEAKTLGATVLRAHANAGATLELAAAQMLADQLLEALPDAALESVHALRDDAVLGSLHELAGAGDDAETRPRPRLKRFADLGLARSALQASLQHWILHVSKRHPLVIAVDDVHRMDEPSQALLAALADQAERQRLLVIATAESAEQAKASAALRLLVSRCRTLTLQPLCRDETQALLTSVFGDVPQVGLLSDRIHAIAAGNPGASMDLAQHLVRKGLILYEGGSWTLPSELQAHELPASAEAAFRARIAELQPLSRWIAEAQALSLHDGLTLEDYARLVSASEPLLVDQAINELVANRVLVSDGRVYTLAHRGWAALLTEDLGDAEREQRHRALAELHDRSDRPPIAAVHHFLSGGLPERALDRFLKFIETADDKEIAALDAAGMKLEVIAPISARALEAARKLGRPAREICELLRWLTMVSVFGDDEYYWQAAPEWLERLKSDSGLTDWNELEAVDSGQRLARAFQAASERYAATPEPERVYRPDEAIKHLVLYVVASIAVGARELDAKLIASLPELLEPFAPISQVIDAIWQNAIATRELACYCQPDKARLRWIDLHARLSAVSGDELRYVERIRDAMAFGIGSIEAAFGLLSAMRWADTLDRDPTQAVSAMYLRKVVRLQQGDWEGAERFRRKAEVLAVQGNVRQMFTGSLIAELSAHALAADLTGVKHAADRIELFAASSPAWRVYQHLAEGLFQQLRGNHEAADEALLRCLALTSTNLEDTRFPIFAWPRAAAARLETLVQLGRYQEAKSAGDAAIARCQELGISVGSTEISRVLALAEAKLGDYPRAAQRLEGLMAEQVQLGVTGLNLGATYEARARIAIWAEDQAAVEKYAALTAQEYRHGRGSPLGARYERLMEEALRAGVRVLPELSEYETTLLAATTFGRRTTAKVDVSQVMAKVADPKDLPIQALRLLCDARGASAGHLYLTCDAGLRLVASFGTEAPEDGLLGFVTDYFEREMRDQDSATGLVTEAGSMISPTSTAWTDCQGIVYEPLPLASVVDGACVYAGIAVLSARGRRGRPANDIQVLADLGGYLLRSGIARGVQASDS